MMILTLLFIFIILGLFLIFENKEPEMPSDINNYHIDKKKNSEQIKKEECEYEKKKCDAGLECNIAICKGIIASGANKTAASGQSGGSQGTTSSSPSPAGTEEPIEPYMDSENYEMTWDSINAGGGYSTSESYLMEDTVGEIATGYSSSETYLNHAGYQQNEEYTISIGVSGDIDLGNIGGVTGGLRSGSTVATVITNSPAGYTMSGKASTSPALKSGANSFADYSLPGSDPEYTWSVASGAAEFGFSPKGTDIKAFFKDNGGTACNTGSSQTAGKCWYPFSTSDVDIASSASANNPGGTDTTLHVQSESRTTLAPGTYTATITLTAVIN